MNDVNEAPDNIRLNGATSIEVIDGTTSFGDLTSDDQDDTGFEYADMHSPLRLTKS
jgi:hypothetical protein